MYKHLLVPTDGSPLSLKAARSAAKLAGGLGARITALYVIPPFSLPGTGDAVMFHVAHDEREYQRGMRKHADGALAKVAAAAGRVRCDTVSTLHEHPWAAIIEAASSRKCDLIVMASHGRRGLAGLLLGSETRKVLTHSKTPVLVCR